MNLRIASGLAEQAQEGQLTQGPGIPIACVHAHICDARMTVRSCAGTPLLSYHPLRDAPISLTFPTSGKSQKAFQLPLHHCHTSHRPSRLGLNINFKKGTDLNLGYTDNDNISADISWSALLY